jgi:hypothetical protein
MAAKAEQPEVRSSQCVMSHQNGQHGYGRADGSSPQTCPFPQRFCNAAMLGRNRRRTQGQEASFV